MENIIRVLDTEPATGYVNGWEKFTDEARELYESGKYTPPEELMLTGDSGYDPRDIYESEYMDGIILRLHDGDYVANKQMQNELSWSFAAVQMVDDSWEELKEKCSWEYDYDLLADMDSCIYTDCRDAFNYYYEYAVQDVKSEQDYDRLAQWLSDLENTTIESIKDSKDEKGVNDEKEKVFRD